MSNGLGILGLAYKAGKLAFGDTAVHAAVRNKRARLICAATDAGERTKQHAADMPNRCNALFVQTLFTREELGRALGFEQCSIAAFTDAGFAWSFARALAQVDAAQYAALEQELAVRHKRTQTRRSRK